MKITVDQIDSIKTCIHKRAPAISIEVHLTDDQAERLFYDIWERFEIKQWIEREGFKLVQSNEVQRIEEMERLIDLKEQEYRDLKQHLRAVIASHENI